MSNIRAIAIHLPQFHPIPENDQWWGKGFTEWTNVVKAKPRFKGHYQPHLPADLGFYDLRLEEARLAQEALAKEYGIYGFCYYHYWFNGRRILEKPVESKLANPKEDFPFMLCWANENWTRKWDGNEKEILLEQKYSDEDDSRHIQSLIPYFEDSRYIKIDGKPVFAIYRSTAFPNIKNTVRIWREEASKHNIQLYLCRFEGFDSGEEYLRDGFDAAIEFPPIGNSVEFMNFLNKKQKDIELLKKISNKLIRIAKKLSIKKNKQERAIEFDYNEFVDWKMSRPLANYNQFPGVTPMWDNSARKKDYLVLKNATPVKYGEWLKHITNNFKPKSKEENFLFINAWNEWAEGNHLEPCQKWGRQYLEATKEVLSDV